MSIADQLITHGWNQGAYVGEDGSLCLFGAVWAESMGHIPAFGDEDLYIDGPQVAALVDASLRHGIDLIAEWQDAPDRTFDEVLRLAKEADEILEEQNEYR